MPVAYDPEESWGVGIRLRRCHQVGQHHHGTAVLGRCERTCEPPIRRYHAAADALRQRQVDTVIDRWLDRRRRSKLEIIRVQVRDIESFEPDCASAVLGQIDRRTASQNTSSQPWNTTIRPMKRTPGNCRARRSSVR